MLKLRSSALALACAISATLLAQSTFKIIDLGTLPGKTYSVATGINDSGQVVGYSWNLNQYGSPAETRAFLWDKGVMTDLGTLPGCTVNSTTIATAINNIGQVVGYSCSPDGYSSFEGTEAFLWEKGVMTDLGTLFVNSYSFAAAINDHGQVVGSSTTRGYPSITHIFLWDKGVMSDLGGPWVRNTATGINARGQVVGYSTDPSLASPTFAFIWQNGVFTNLGNLGARGYTAAYGINDRGEVVGVTSTLHGPSPAFLWNKGVMTSLGAFSANAINARSQVVGEAGGRALFWDDGAMIDLGTLPADSFSRATGVNALGQVVGFSASFGKPPTQHAVLWHAH